MNRPFCLGCFSCSSHRSFLPPLLYPTSFPPASPPPVRSREETREKVGETKREREREQSRSLPPSYGWEREREEGRASRFQHRAQTRKERGGGSQSKSCVSIPLVAPKRGTVSKREKIKYLFQEETPRIRRRCLRIFSFPRHLQHAQY